jgi:hypothetical protein
VKSNRSFVQSPSLLNHHDLKRQHHTRIDDPEALRHAAMKHIIGVSGQGSECT